MKAKVSFVIFIPLIFSMHALFAMELDTNKFLNEGNVYSMYKSVNWEIQNAFGFQRANIFSDIDSDGNESVSEAFCRGTSISLFLDEDWKFTSLFMAGFHLYDLPAMFTPNSIPYFREDWISFQSEILLSRKIQVSKKITLLPFVGYDYTLFTFPEIYDGQIENKNHSIIAGVEFSWKPANFIGISASVFTVPVLNMNPLTQSRFFAGTKFNATFSIYKVYLNIFNSIKFNFYSNSNNLYLIENNLIRKKLPFYLFEIGVRFRVAI